MNSEGFDFSLHAHAINWADKILDDATIDTTDERHVLAYALYQLEEARGLPVDLDNLKCIPSVQLVSGHYLNFLAPEKSWLLPTDIAHNLSKVPRFGGANLSDKIYSVAQHTVLGSLNIDDEYAFEFLMHDVTEFVMADMMTPLKQLLPDYRHYEATLERAVADRFFLPHAMSPAVKKMDAAMGLTEKRDLMRPSNHVWTSITPADPLNFMVREWNPADAKEAWLRRFNDLWPAHAKKHGLPSDFVVGKPFGEELPEESFRAAVSQ